MPGHFWIHNVLNPNFKDMLSALNDAKAEYGRNELLINKLAAGRPKDLLDADILKSME